MITDRNAGPVRVEHVFDRTGKKTVLVVGTDLQLDPAEIDFEPEQIAALWTDIEAHQQSIAYVDAVRLVRRCSAPASEPIEMTGTFGTAQMTIPLKST